MAESQEELDKIEGNILPDAEYAGRNILDEEVFAQPARSQKRPRRWIILTSSILLVIVFAGVGFSVLRSHSSSPTYSYQTVTLSDLSLTVNATGSLEGDTYDADFAVNGTISEIDVKVGQHVDKNQILAKLDPNSIINPPGINTASYSVLKAPHAGFVTAINGVVGGNPGTGNIANGTGSFIQIEDLSSLRIQANVNESDIGNVKPGNRVNFTVSAYGDQVFHGVVSAISPMGNSVSNVVTYPTTIDVDMDELKGLKDVSLLPGMTANVTITTIDHSNVLLIPANAVNFAQAKANQTGSDAITHNQAQAALTQAQQMLLELKHKQKNLSEDNPTAAYVLERTQNRWVVKPVVLGLTDDTSYEVLAGLSEHETIVVGEQANSTAFSGKEKSA
jgi:multidrug efflux pump subunit AcrA (membrane-fusion protein)